MNDQRRFTKRLGGLFKVKESASCIALGQAFIVILTKQDVEFFEALIWLHDLSKQLFTEPHLHYIARN